MSHSWLFGYLACIPVGCITYYLGTLRHQGTIAVLERKLQESTADRQLLIDKYDAQTKSCSAITSHSHALEEKHADLSAAYSKLFIDAEKDKRELSKLRLKAVGARKTAKP